MIRTMADYIAEQGGIEAMIAAGSDPLLARLQVVPGAAQPLYRCDCGRQETPDSMVDLDNPGVAARVPPKVRELVHRGRKRNAASSRFRCVSGCLAHWGRTQAMGPRDALRRAIGAPDLPPESRAPW